jgi:hypothetical protein
MEGIGEMHAFDIMLFFAGYKKIWLLHTLKYGNVFHR